MSKRRGVNGKVTITDAAGTARDISDWVQNIEWSEDTETYDSTGFGATARARVAGFDDATVTMSGRWDNNSTASPEPWITGLGTATSVVTDWPDGSASGKPYTQATMIRSNFTRTQPYDELIDWSAEFVLAAGSVARGTA